MHYIKCPKCELNYIDADKQELCDVCLIELGTKIKVVPRAAFTPTPIIKDPIRYKGRAVFFVFQSNKDFPRELSEGVIKAPYADKGMREPHHWTRLSKVKEGDIILHGVNGFIVSISEAKGPCYDFHYKDAHTGRKVDCDYHKLETPLMTSKFKTQIIQYCSHLDYQPFNKNGTGNQGYLFDISLELATLFISDIVANNPSLSNCIFINDILS